MAKDLRQFLKRAKELGPDYYVEVKKTLKPKFEKDVIQLKLAREGRYPVIYCPEIEGSKLPLVSNLFGSYEMLGLALGMDPRTSTTADFIKEYRKREHDLKPVKEIDPSEAPVKEVILRGKDVDLGLLPIQFHAEMNSGKYLSIAQMLCIDPDTGTPNCGVYRHEVKSKNVIGAMLVPSHHAAYIARRLGELGKPMEVALFIGHHPAVVFGSLAWGSIDVNELELMGAILQEPLRVTRGETVDLPIPADAEIVLEGILDPTKQVTDGPFAEWTGYYGDVRNCYLIQINCITMRKDAIYHDLAPSQREHQVSTAFTMTNVIYNAVRAVVPTVKEVYLPYSGQCNMLVYISIAKRVAGEPVRAGLAAINVSEAPVFAVIVDEDIDVYNEEEVLWAIATRAKADNIVIVPQIITDPLIPTTYDESRLKPGTMGSKVIIDATKPLQSPFPERVMPPEDLWKSMKLEDYLA